MYETKVKLKKGQNQRDPNWENFLGGMKVLGMQEISEAKWAMQVAEKKMKVKPSWNIRIHGQHM